MAMCLNGCGAETPAAKRGGKARLYCSAECQKSAGNRKLGEGSAVIVAAKAWAMTRHAKPGTREAAICAAARSELTAILRDLNASDAHEGRSAVDVFEAMMSDGTRWMDRKRG